MEIFWTWAEMYPCYNKRMQAMARKANIMAAYHYASMMMLQPKE